MEPELRGHLFWRNGREIEMPDFAARRATCLRSSVQVMNFKGSRKKVGYPKQKCPLMGYKKLYVAL